MTQKQLLAKCRVAVANVLCALDTVQLSSDDDGEEKTPWSWP